MEIFTLLETLEDILEKSRNMPFSSKCIVDKEVVLEAVRQHGMDLDYASKELRADKEIV